MKPICLLPGSIIARNSHSNRKAAFWLFLLGTAFAHSIFAVPGKGTGFMESAIWAKGEDISETANTTCGGTFSESLTSVKRVCSAEEDVVVQLYELFDQIHQWHLAIDPFLASDEGIRSANRLLPDAGFQALEENRNRREMYLRRLRSIPYDCLQREDRIHYRMLERQLAMAVESYDLGEHLMPLNGWWDYHASFAEQPVRMPFRNLEDYENYIARLNAFSLYNRQHIERLQAGVNQGRVRPKVVLKAYIPTVEAHLTTPEESRFLSPFERFSPDISHEEQQRLKAAALEAVEQVVLPEYRRLAEFLRQVYYEAAPEEIGISNQPGGEAYYQHLVRYYTTLDVAAEELHQIGLQEVERIREEMFEVMAQTGFEGSFSEFISFLRIDPQFYARDAEELLQYTALLLKRMDGELPRFFGRLPRMPYGLREVPDYLAPRMTTAYYNRPASDGSRAGFYYVNTYDLSSRPLYEVEALSFHEAVPGHHMQLALQQELDNLPSFRRQANVTAFIEGWALYAEWLAQEMGFYTDAYSNFGRLTYEMWRALRLVVDTGIHAGGWTRDQAIAYMAENSALTLLNIGNEVDRYIFWPGQALAYKTGERVIRQLRARAEEELGENFYIRAFHDAVLENGSITLEVLEEQITRWIISVKAEREMNE